MTVVSAAVIFMAMNMAADSDSMITTSGIVSGYSGYYPYYYDDYSYDYPYAMAIPPTPTRIRLMTTAVAMWFSDACIPCMDGGSAPFKSAADATNVYRRGSRR